jgi:hypothetical protein
MEEAISDAIYRSAWLPLSQHIEVRGTTAGVRRLMNDNLLYHQGTRQADSRQQSGSPEDELRMRGAYSRVFKG